MAENKEPQVIIEDESKDYNNVLEKFETPAETKSGAKEKKSHIKALVIALISAVVLIGIVLLLVLLPKGEDKGYESSSSASITTNADKNNVWQAKVETKNNGDIKTNGSGTLMEYVPAQIKKIQIENTKGSLTIGSYTPTKVLDETDPDTGEKKTETDATVYTVKGLEGFDLQAGIPDEVASNCASLEFNTIIEADASDNLADYGLADPRSVTTITYTDGKKAVIYVGNDAPQGAGTYVKFGSSNAVYLVESSSVSALLYGVTDLVSLTINDSATTTDNSEFEYLNISGTGIGSNITLKPNDKMDSISNAYVLTAPQRAYADDAEASYVTGAIRGLYAESVAYVNPTAAQLSKCGLSAGYAKVSAKYPDITVKLVASKPDSKGNCYIMKQGGKVVYKMASASLPWVSTSYQKLVSDYIINPQLTGLTGLNATIGDMVYAFEVKTTTTETTDDEGSTTSSSTTTAKFGGKVLTQSYFEVLFRNMALLTKCDNDTETPKGNADLTIRYSFSDKSKSDDVVCFYKSANNKHLVTLNSKPVGHVYSSYVKKLVEQVPKTAKDKEVKTFW